MVLLGCASTPKAEERPPPDAEPKRPDEKAITVPTKVEAGTARLVLSDRWRDEVKLEAIHVDRGEPDEWTAEGAPTFKLRGIDLRAKKRITLTFLPDHEHFLLHAKDVDLVERRVGFIHRHTDLDAVTIADNEMSIFSR